MAPFEKSAKVFFENCDVNSPNYNQCRNDRNRSGRYFAWRDTAVNLYITGEGWGGVTGNLIGLCETSDCNIQIHELGHFFGLGHTMGDDGIADTLVDDEHWNKNAIANNNFHKPYDDPNRPLTLQQKKQVDDVWNNIMSYHQPSWLTSILTNNQLGEMG